MEEENPVGALQLLSEREAAKLLGVSRTTLWRLRDSRKIGFVLVGTSVKYRAEHITQFIERGEHQPEQRRKV
jgi:excisionase family DNA binding protein